MKKIKFEIKNRWTGKILFSYESENPTAKKAVLEAIKSGADLRRADLSGADLRRADLSGADLSDADLSGADLSDANLRRADLSPIKNDFFIVLLHAIPEIPNLKKAIVDGKINGSVYDGECACLNGTLAKCDNPTLKDQIISVRDSSRPIERFFLGINVGDTPESSQFSKLALEWLEEFERLINNI